MLLTRCDDGILGGYHVPIPEDRQGVRFQVAYHAVETSTVLDTASYGLQNLDQDINLLDELCDQVGHQGTLH